MSIELAYTGVGVYVWPCPAHPALVAWRAGMAGCGEMVRLGRGCVFQEYVAARRAVRQLPMAEPRRVTIETIDADLRQLRVQLECRLHDMLRAKRRRTIPLAQTPMGRLNGGSVEPSPKRRRISFAAQDVALGFAHSSDVYDRRTVGTDINRNVESRYVAPLMRDEHELVLKDEVDRTWANHDPADKEECHTTPTAPVSSIPPSLLRGSSSVECTGEPPEGGLCRGT